MEPRCVLFVCFLFFSFGRARSYGLPRWLSRKESACNAGDAGDLGSVPGLGISPLGGNGNLLQYSYLENPRDRGAWRATVHGFSQRWT